MAAYDWDEYLEKAKKIDSAKAAVKTADPMQDLYARAKKLDEARANPTPVARKETASPMALAGSSAKGGFSTGAMRASANGGGVVNAPAVLNAPKQTSVEEKKKENYNRLQALAGRKKSSNIVQDILVAENPLAGINRAVGQAMNVVRAGAQQRLAEEEAAQKRTAEEVSKATTPAEIYRAKMGAFEQNIGRAPTKLTDPLMALLPEWKPEEDPLEQQAMAAEQRYQASDPNIATDIAKGAVGMIGDMAVAGATGIPYRFVMAGQSGAQAAQDTFDETGDAEKALLKGLGSGAISAEVEAAFGIAGKWGTPLLKKIGASPAGQKVLSALPQKALNFLATLSESKVGQILGSGLGEGMEELAEYDLQRVFENLLLDKDTPRDVKEQLYSAFVGAGIGGIFSAAGNIASSIGNRMQNSPATAEGKIDPLAELEKGLKPEVDPLAELKQGFVSEAGTVTEPGQVREPVADPLAELEKGLSPKVDPLAELEKGLKPETDLLEPLKNVEEGKNKTARGGVVADLSLFDPRILENLNEARKNLIEYARKVFPKSVVNNSTGKEIGISRRGLDKLLSGRISKEKYASAFHVPELIKIAVKVDKAGNYHENQANNIPTYEYYESPITIEGKEYKAHIRVKNTLLGDKYYGHTISEVEDIKIEPSARTYSALAESWPVHAIEDSFNTSVPQEHTDVNESVSENEQNYTGNVPVENVSEEAAAVEPDYSTEGELRQAKADNHNTEKWNNYAKAWGELSQRYGTTDDAEIAARATKEEYDELSRLYEEAEEDRVESLLKAMDEKASVERTRMKNRVTNDNVRDMIADDENAIIRPEVTVDAKAVATDSEADIKAAADEGRADPATWIVGNQLLLSNKDIARVLDTVARDDKGFDAADYGKRRNTLYEVFERPLYRAKARYARNVTRKMTDLAKKADELGIKTGTPEAEAVTWIGEGQRQIISPKAKEPQMVEYTEADLIEQFGDRAGAIMEMAGYLRTMYDDLYKDYDRMIRQIYPSVEAIVKKAEESKTWHEQRVNYYQTQALVQTEAAEEYRTKMAQIAEHAEKAADPGVKAALKNRANELEQQAMQADLAAKRLMANSKRAATLAQKWQKKIDSGELWKNKRLPYRENYFPHYEKRGGFVSDLLSAATGERISSGLAGVSEFTKPKSIYWGSAQRRSAGSNMIYEADALAAAKRYIQEAEERIAIDPVIAQMRGSITELAEATADTKSANGFLTWATKWTNDLAHKTGAFDRAINDEMQRGFLPVLRVINNRIKANAVVGNIGSAIVQIGNLPNATMYVTTPDSWLWATRKMMEGSALAQRIRGNGDAIDPQQMSPFLQERYLNRVTDLIDDRGKVEKAANWLLEVGDRTAAELTWLAAYHQYRNDGAGKAAMRGYVNAIDYADDITRRSIGGRGIGELPLTQKSELVKLAAPFQVEVNNTYQAIKEQVGRRNAAGLINYALTAALVNAIIEAVRGSKPLFDPIDALYDAYKIATEDEEEEKTGTEKAAEIAVRLLGEAVTAVPYAQPLATLFIGEDNSEMYFGENDPTRYGTGIQASVIFDPLANLLAKRTIDPLEGLFDVVPSYGGAQLKRMYQMGQNVGVIPEVRLGVKDGLSFERTSEGFAASETNNGGIRFPIETDPLNLLQGMAFGQYATREGREYIEEGRSPMSDTASQKYAAAVAGGVDPAVYYAAYLAQKGIQGDKDSSGNTVQLSASRNKKAAIDAVLTPDITKAQRQLIYEAFGVSKQVW